MSIQSNTLSRRLDVDLDLDNPLKAKSTAKLKVEQLNVVIDCSDAGFVNTRPRAIGDRTYVSGKMLRFAAAMVLIDLRRSSIEGKDDFGKLRLESADEGRLDSSALWLCL